MTIVFLLIGFCLLIYGANFFVESSSAIARALKIPAVVIGLTIVALGTSAPEAAVSISASFKGSSDISVSNIIGSNLFNLFLIIGICTVIKPIKLDKKIVLRDFPVSIFASLFLLIFCFNGHLNRIEGLIIFLGIIVYLSYLVTSSLKQRDKYEEKESQEKKKPLALSIFLLIAGLAMIIFGGNLVVDNACKIASYLGISQTLIGVTIVAAGTSLPELVTSVVAIKKGENGLAVGNVIGSNIFNILGILGASSMVKPLSVNLMCVIDCIILITGSILLYIAIYKNHRITRLMGALCLAFYSTYMAYAIIR